MLICCWSATGGAGTTVVASCMALLLAARESTGAVLADLVGDVPAVLGLPEPSGPGLAEWLDAGDDVPADALDRLAVDAHPGLSLLPRGQGALGEMRADALASLLTHDARPVVADCGGRLAGARARLAGVADRSILVTRLCYVALRRARRHQPRPTEVVVLREPGRALEASDVEEVVGAPVVTEIEVEPGIFRAVDAGLLTARRLPHGLRRALRDVA